MAEKDSRPAQPRGPDWRARRTTPAAAQRVAASKRRNKIIVLGAILLAGAGAIGGWLLSLRQLPEPHFLSIPITEYKAPQWPVNPWAVQDSRLLLARFTGQGKASQAFESQDRELYRKELLALEKVGDRPVIVHLRALAVPRDGDLYLLPADAEPGAPETWVSLQDVVQTIQRSPSAHKLLLLDVCQPVANPLAGVLLDDVIGAVVAQSKKLDTKNLLILLPCSPGQTSLVSQELGHSVFAHYLDRGLSGLADGYGPQGHIDGRVSVKELAAYVRFHVVRWAEHNRGVKQIPVLLGDGDDFHLSVPEHKAIESAETETEPLAYPTGLTAAWENCDKGWDEKASAYAPQALHGLTETLLRAEQRWLGGADPARVLGETENFVRGFQNQLNKARPSVAPAPISLVQLIPPGVVPDPASLEALRILLQKAVAVPPLPPADLMKAKQEFLDKHKELKPDRLAQLILRGLKEDVNPQPATLRFLNELLDAKSAPRSVETLLLRRFVDLADEVNNRIAPSAWPGGAIHLAFQVTESAEQACQRNAYTLAWLEPMWTEADRQRREALAVIFGLDVANWKDTAKLELAESAYQKIKDYNDALIRAQEIVDRSVLILPSVMPYLLWRHERADQNEWDAAVKAMLILQALLSNPRTTDLPNVDTFRKPAAELRARISYFDQFFQPARLSQAKAWGPQGGPREYAEVQALLQTPFLWAKDRAALWSAAHAIAERLNSDTETLDQANEQDKQSTQNLNVSESASPNTENLDRGMLLARWSIDLLRLGGMSGTDALVKDFDALQRTADEAGLARLGGKIREFWTDQLPKQLARERSDVFADRLIRIQPVYERDASGNIDIAKNPSTGLYYRRWRAFWQWLADRYHAEAAMSAYANKPGSYAEFYDNAEKECRRQAR